MFRFPIPLRRFLAGAVTALVLIAGTSTLGSAQGQSAVVDGTRELFIRRGPGREFPPFATLTGGSQVRLLERHGTWARITTASGQVGYVDSKFLRVAAEESVPPTPGSAAALPTLTSAPQRSSPTTRRPTRTPRRRAEPAVNAPETTSTDAPTPSRAVPTPTAISAAGNPSQRAGRLEIEELREAVEALNHRLDQRFPLPEGDMQPGDPEESSSAVSGGAILLALFSGVVGWVLGQTYQRNKERGRRSRIRL